MARLGDALWQYVCLTSVLALLTAISFFTVAVALLPKNAVDERPAKPMEDITFLLPLSSTISTVLKNCLEIQKLVLHGTSNGKVAVSLLLLIVAVVLSIVAPAVYGSGNDSKPWWTVNPVILSFAANMLSILANVLGVLTAGSDTLSFRRLLGK